VPGADGVSRIDPGTNTVVATNLLATGMHNATGMAAGYGAVWVGLHDPGAGMVARVDGRTLQVSARIRAGSGPSTWRSPRAGCG
jgi:hypothetical protein